MSTFHAQPAEAPVLVRSSIEDRWREALNRAKASGITAYQVGLGRYAVTSATDPQVAYLTDGVSCTCPAAQYGDAVCIHRALVRDLQQPQPEPPTHTAYDPDVEALQWAYNDRDRAYRDLERYNDRILRGDVLNDHDFASFLRAQEREQDAHRRIVALKAQQRGTVAA